MLPGRSADSLRSHRNRCMKSLHPMNNCLFLDSLKSLFSTGKCDSGECPLGKIPPIGHIIIAGSVVVLLTVLLGTLVSKPRRD